MNCENKMTLIIVCYIETKASKEQIKLGQETVFSVLPWL